MGELKVTKLTSKEDKANYIFHLLKDIEALDFMINNNLIEKTPIRIGAEQEFCLVDNEFLPNNNAVEILKDINDSHFTTEIGNYNLEINLDPIELKNDCFSSLHKQLSELIKKASTVANKKQTKILLTGILPTLTLKHIGIQNMTPIERYYVLNEAIKESRKQDFNIHIKGIDEINLLHDTVMLEGCNTSFQMHLQVDPDTFIDTYNWAQAISGPVLSVCTNSPLLFGKELWSETRIALFTQSVDTRANSFLLNEKQSRVSFGSNWSTGSVADIFRDNVSRFRSLVTTEFKKDSVDMLENGEIPGLKALNLHNGTVYRWNRPCYGVGGGKPHLRIENRYIPSGPTMLDEIANMVFWVGVMMGKPKMYDNIHEKMDFKDAKSNFFNAARYGMNTQFHWNGEIRPSHELILEELLPMAYKGLYKMGVSPKDAEYYLKIIKNRVTTNNGSQWAIKSYRNLLKTKKRFEAIQILTCKMYKKQQKEYPISTWNVIKKDTIPEFVPNKIVKHAMSSDIFSVDVSDSLDLVISIMRWKKFNHMPVINEEKELVGLLSSTDMEKYKRNPQKGKHSIKDIMQKDIITINQYSSATDASKLMKKHNINSLPVVEQNKLIGIITSKDI
ncbi:CBS domain-containing protein [Pontimicrobium sp. SW4]|uniref:CBS domain-containing protein n=1 Tax=Pontimicrobium sp. SW4 TaxID=3153519 RepID=A0AAU7BSB1_9FLAO